MAYNIRYSDQVNKGVIVIEDSTLNTETSLSLPGRNITAYGQAISENFLHLLENFAHTVSPTNPTEGQLWYDTTPGVDQLKLYDGTTWVAAGGLKKANLAPEAANSVVGDLWVDTDNQQLYLFAGSNWLLVGPEFAEGLATGTKPVKVTSTTDAVFDILQVEIGGKVIAIPAPQATATKSRKFFDSMDKWAKKEMQAPGLGYARLKEAEGGGVESQDPVLKNFEPAHLKSALTILFPRTLNSI